MRKLIHLLLFVSLIAGCVMPRPKAAREPNPTTPPNPQCAWSWTTQPLPELSTKVEAAMRSAGLKGLSVSAEAYGENCITNSGKVDHFAAMETDFHIAAQVTNLKDPEQLGNQLERILVVLDGFPTETTPGPNPGYVGLTFRMGSEGLNLWFQVKAGKSARANGKHGAALFEELQKK
jgi:hypothetical protein